MVRVAISESPIAAFFNNHSSRFIGPDLHQGITVKEVTLRVYLKSYLFSLSKKLLLVTYNLTENTHN